MCHISYHLRRVLDLQSFLSHFECVQGGGTNAQGNIQYTAKCPSHETNHQSLALSVTRDGRYLVHCFAGCPAADVVRAVGLALTDLYPDGAMYEQGVKPLRHGLEHEVDENVLDIARETRKQGGRLSEADKRREREAFVRSRRNREWPL